MPHSAPSVDFVDVTMMSQQMVRRWGGTIYFVASDSTALRSASRLTAWWNADDLTGQTTSVIAAGGLSVGLDVRTGKPDALPALMYRLLWELDAVIAEELGEDAEW